MGNDSDKVLIVGGLMIAVLAVLVFVVKPIQEKNKQINK
jgi:hypothetical protein